jgi:hypothetical protein
VKTWEFDLTCAEFRRKLDTGLAYGKNPLRALSYATFEEKLEELTGEDLEDSSSEKGWELVFANEEALSATSTLTSTVDSDALPRTKCFRVKCGVTHTSDADGITSTGTLFEHSTMADDC